MVPQRRVEIAPGYCANELEDAAMQHTGPRRGWLCDDEKNPISFAHADRNRYMARST